MGINYRKCIKCGSNNVVPIIYGMPGAEVPEAEQAGKVKLGGCCIDVTNPEYYCKDCKHEWNREEAIDAAYKTIKALKASVGGYFDGYYSVYIDVSKLHVTWSFSLSGDDQTLQKAIRAQTAANFIEQLKMVNLLNWKARYIRPGVCDGTQWKAEIITDGRTLRKVGDNKFPAEWDMFCRIISRLTKKPFTKYHVLTTCTTVNTILILARIR